MHVRQSLARRNNPQDEKMTITKMVIKIVATHLKDRKFLVKINKETSDIKDVETEVPQNSILVLILYTLTIPKLYNSKIAQYVNDTVIYTHCRRKNCSKKTSTSDEMGQQMENQNN